MGLTYPVIQTNHQQAEETQNMLTRIWISFTLQGISSSCIWVSLYFFTCSKKAVCNINVWNWSDLMVRSECFIYKKGEESVLNTAFYCMLVCLGHWMNLCKLGYWGIHSIWNKCFLKVVTVFPFITKIHVTDTKLNAFIWGAFQCHLYTLFITTDGQNMGVAQVTESKELYPESRQFGCFSREKAEMMINNFNIPLLTPMASLSLCNL